MKKQLFVVHNLSSENLEFTDLLGGLPCPSLAIISNEGQFRSFGEITLIADSNSLNMRDYDIFESDSYSARCPEIRFALNHSELEVVKAKINDAMSHFGISDQEFKEYNLYRNDFSDNDKLEQGLYKKSQELINNKGLKLLYIYEQGIPLKLKFEKIPPPISFLSMKSIREIERKGLSNTRNDNAREEILSLDSVQADITKSIKEMYGDEFDYLTDDDIKYEKSIIESAAGFNKDGVLSPTKFYQLSTYINDKKQDYKKINFTHLSDALDKKIPHDSKRHDHYIKWIDSTIGASIGRPFFTQDGKTTEANIDTLTKSMTGKTRASENTIFKNVGDIRAALTGKIKNLKGIESKAGMIVPKEYFKEYKDKSINALRKLIDDLEPKFKFHGGHHYTDSAVRVLISYALKKNIAVLNESFNVDDDDVKEISDFFNELKSAPTEYFELKSKKHMELREFSHAIVPKNLDKNVINILIKNRITIHICPEKKPEMFSKLLSKTKMGFADLGTIEVIKSSSQSSSMTI